MGNAQQDYPSKANKRREKAESKVALAKVPFASYRFVRIEFTEAEKVRFRELYAGGEFGEPPIDHWLDSGYKLSLSKDAKSGSVIASLTGQYSDMLNAGLVLTGRGGAAAVALAALEFKDSYLADETGWGAAEALRGGSYDDVG